MAKSKSKPKASVRRQRKKPETAHSRSLPGLEGHNIPELDDVAESYAEIRDERMELTQREAELKANTISLMKKHGKRVYRHDGIEITLVTGEDDVKVRVKKHTDDDNAETIASGDGDASAPAPADDVTFGDVTANAGEFADERREAVNSED